MRLPGLPPHPLLSFQIMHNPTVSFSRHPSTNAKRSSTRRLRSLPSGNVETTLFNDALGKRLEGRKMKVLSIAIQDYRLSLCHSISPLNAPRNDQDSLVSYAKDHGCAEENIVVMRENSPVEKMLPTRINILHQIDLFVSGSEPGDLLLFHYSGHGHQVPTNSDTETDGMDEAIVTMDQPNSQQLHLITDNILRKKLVDPLQTGICLIAIMDACNSGTLLDLDSTRKRKRPSAASSVQCSSPRFILSPRNSSDIPASDAHSLKRSKADKTRTSSQSNTDEPHKESRGRASSHFSGGRRCASPERYYNVDEHPHIICFSACRDGQRALSGGHLTFTHYVIELLRSIAFRPISPNDLGAELNTRLRARRHQDMPTQKPSLIARLNSLQIAQVNTLAGQEELLDWQFVFPHPIAGRRTGRRRTSSHNTASSEALTSSPRESTFVPANTRLGR